MKHYLLDWEETLFKNREIFEMGYVPDEFLYRELQIRSISYAIAPGIKGMKPQNIVCIGPQGTGKTTSFRKIIEEAEEITPSNLIFAHVNCRYTHTHYSVLSEIYKKISGIDPPNSGIGLKKLYEKIAHALSARNKCLFVILDDADYLILKKIFHEVVNNVIRLYEEYPVNVGLSSVHSTQYPSSDSRLTSAFIPTIIRFSSYNWDETFNILNMRAMLGLYPGVVRSEIIERITDFTLQKGDIRFGIDLLRRSIISAELRASKVLEIIDVESALVEASDDRMQRYLNTFTFTENSLMEIITEKGSAKSGDLFTEFQIRTDKGYTTFNKTLNKLINTKLVDVRFENMGKKGRTRIISVKQVNH